MLTNNEVMDSEDWVPYSETVIWNLTIGDGEKIVYVWVRDRVGRISRSSTVSTKLLAQYIGNNGTNSTSYKMLIKDANYNFNSQLTNSDVSIKVKSGGTTTYTGAAGSGTPGAASGFPQPHPLPRCYLLSLHCLVPGHP